MIVVIKNWKLDGYVVLMDPLVSMQVSLMTGENIQLDWRRCYLKSMVV